MKESQIAVKDFIHENWEGYLKLMPELVEPYEALPQEVYKDGEIKAKYKRMMAIVGALVSGCRACILYQVEGALAAGATADEILESCAVAISLGGTMAAGETTRVVALLRELGEIE